MPIPSVINLCNCKKMSFMGLLAYEFGSSASADQGQVHNDIVESDAAKSSALYSLKNAVHSAELLLSGIV